MSLKTVVDDLEEVEEKFRDLYEQDESGKYVLSVDDVDSHPKVSNLKNAYEQEKQKRRKAAEDRDGIKQRVGRLLDTDPDLDLADVDDETLHRALAIVKGETDPNEPDPNDPNKKGKGQDIDIDKIKANARKPLERELEAAKAEAEKWQNLAQRTLIDNALSSALTRAGVKDPDYRELLTERFRRQCRIDESEGEFSVLMDGEYGEMDPGNWVKEWAQTDYAKKFIDAGGNSGGGASGNGRGDPKVPNPWKKETENFDEQLRIAREDPERAKRMAAEAGKKLRM